MDERLQERVEARRTPWARIASGAGAVLILLALYHANRRVTPSGDNMGTRALATTLAREGSFDLSATVAGAPGSYSIVRVADSSYNGYPSGTAVLAAPIYFLDALLRRRSAALQFEDAHLEKLAASWITALAVVGFLIAARPHLGLPGTALAGGFLTLATPVLTTMSQGLWSFTGELAAISGSLYLASRSAKAGTTGGATTAIAGVLCGFAAFCRPTALLLVPFHAVFVKGRRPWAIFLSGCLGTGLVIVAFHLWIYGSLLGQYGALSRGKFELGWRTFGSSLAGVLFSPSWGLAIFFPALLLAAGLLIRSRGEARRSLVAVAASGVSIVILLASWEKWWGGQSVGPRLLGELALPGAWIFGVAWKESRGVHARRALGASLVLQAGCFLLLHFSPRSVSWPRDVAVDANPEIRWSLRDSQLVAAATPGWKYEESGPYFDADVLATSSAGHLWNPLDLGAAANGTYLEEAGCAVRGSPAESTALCLERLAGTQVPGEAHLRIRPVSPHSAVRTCRGETSLPIEADGAIAKRVDTLIQWRGTVSEEEIPRRAGYVVLEFANGRRSALHLNFGQQILLRSQLDFSFDRVRGRFYGGRPSAPDAIQRQRFTIPGKDRSVSRLWLEVPEDAPEGCLYLLAVSLGVPE